MSFALYLFGTLLVIAGVAWAMSTAHVPLTWIGITSLILVGVGILSGVAHTRSRDTPK